MGRSLVALRKRKPHETKTADVAIDAPTQALHALMRTIDGMATKDDSLAIETGIHVDGSAELAILDSTGFPLFILGLRSGS